MSGGHFDYNQHRILDIIDSVERLIETNGKSSDNDSYREYSDDIIQRFELGLTYLKIAHVYAQRIDWLVSGDDGEESFLKRLDEDLRNLKIKNETLNDKGR